RWPTVGGLSDGFLSARPCALPLLSRSLLSLTPGGLCAAASPVLLYSYSACRGRSLYRLPRSATHCRVGGLRQAALWRTPTSPGLSGPLYAWRGDRQSSLGCH